MVEAALNEVLSNTVGKTGIMLGAVIFNGLRLGASPKQVQDEGTLEKNNNVIMRIKKK